MAKEKITPDRKSVPSSGGVKETRSHLTTPKQSTDGKAPWGKEAKESIM
jgi:hypothetical protein